ncbi:MAG: hypothetical protein GY778_22720 [bacterium]|nr:hypothetical protein [bacterium]
MSRRPKPIALLALLACLSAAGGCMDQVVADAGANRTVSGGDTVLLDGSDSTPKTSGRLDYLWEVVDGPDVAFSSSTARQTTFDAPRSSAETIYRIRLTATYVDLSGQLITSNRDTDDVIIRVHADADAESTGDATPDNSSDESPTADDVSSVAG